MAILKAAKAACGQEGIDKSQHGLAHRKYVQATHGGLLKHPRELLRCMHRKHAVNGALREVQSGPVATPSNHVPIQPVALRERPVDVAFRSTEVAVAVAVTVVVAVAVVAAVAVAVSMRYSCNRISTMVRYAMVGIPPHQR